MHPYVKAKIEALAAEMEFNAQEIEVRRKGHPNLKERLRLADRIKEQMAIAKEFRDLLKSPRYEDLSGIVFEGLGEASLCWEPAPAGVFQSEQAADVGERVIKRIMDVTK